MTQVWLPNTIKHPIPHIDHGVMSSVEGVVIHINDGSLAGTLAWWANADGDSHEADGAQLEVAKSARVYQTMPINHVAWHAPPENHRLVGIEHEGWSLAEHPQDHRTLAQLHASANRVAWIHHEFHLGHPVHGFTVFAHSDFPQGHHACPGPWDWNLYMNLCTAAYYDHWGR